MVCLFRIVGSYSLYAQQLVRNGQLSINEPLVDTNNRVIEVRTRNPLKTVFNVFTGQMPFLTSVSETIRKPPLVKA